MATYFPTKYATARDEVLDVLAGEFADDSSGDVDAPCGHYASVEFADVATVERELTPEAMAIAHEYGVGMSEFVGWHIVRTDSNGFVGVESFDTVALFTARWYELERIYGEWSGDLDDDA